MENKNLFGNTMKDIRESRDLTIRFFGELIGISSTYVCDLENGHRYPTKRVFDSIEENLFLTEEEQKNLQIGYYMYHPEIPADVAYYLHHNELIETIQAISHRDADGRKFKQYAKILLQEKSN